MKRSILFVCSLILCSAPPTFANMATSKSEQQAKVGVDKWHLAGYRQSDAKVSAHKSYRPLKRVLVTLAAPALIEQLESVAPGVEFVGVAGVNPGKEVNGQFDAVMLVCSLPAALDYATSSAWIHSYSAGVEGCVAHSALQESLATNQPPIMTNSSGTAASVIGEHAIAMMMSFSRGLHVFRDKQHDREWSRSLVAESDITSTIGGKTMLILGLGSIGKEVAIRANALGMKVIATRHSSREGPDYVDYVGLSSESLELAAQADVVVNALPLTHGTEKLADKKFFEVMKSSALYISVGRGGTTDTDDLLEALKTDKIAGAALDVTDPEPLPADHPLWQQSNVIITPHLAGTGGNARPKVFKLLLENVRRYQAGEALLNPVDPQAGY